MHASLSSPLAAGASPLPEHLAQAVWRGDSLGRAEASVVPSGHALLDAQLPGGGWPCRAMTEVLQAQAGMAEWRLLSPALASLVRRGGSVLMIGPPFVPHVPGLCREGLSAERLIRIDADTPAERLWATEQALKAVCLTAVLSWLPQARPDQIRRLQACATRHPGLFFAFRPMRVQADSSAAPLRVALSVDTCPHPLQVHILKRRGPAMEEPLLLFHWAQGLEALLPASAASLPQVSPPAPLPSSPSPHPAPQHAALDRVAAWNASAHS